MAKSRPAALWSLLGAALLLAALAGCNPDAPQSTISPTTESTRDIHSLYVIIFWAAVLVFVLVEGMLLYAVIRFRRKPDDPMPRQVHGNRTLEILWTTFPAIILVVIAVPTWRVIFDLADKAPEGALRVEVIGHQWWWEFNYPDLGFATANEMRVPVGRPVDLEITSKDVIHAFQAPQLFQKMDAMPGKRHHVVFTAEQVRRPEDGVPYFGQCFELCGEAHADMRFRVYALEPADFDAWAAKHKAPPQISADDLVQRGRAIFQTQNFATEPGTPATFGNVPRWGCIACHASEGAGSTIGPNLTYLGERTTLAAGIMDRDAENLARWIRNPQEVKPGALMPRLGLNEFEVQAVAAYLESMK